MMHQMPASTTPAPQQARRQLTLATLLVLLAACSSFDFPGVYKIEVPQGNVYDEEMIDKLEIGMTPSQVRFIMGTPLIQDTFNPNRWDYSYQVQKGAEVSEKKKMTLYFENDRLASITQGDEVAEQADSQADRGS